ncbi:MAG: hypothetical protein ABH829_04470 [archaeon]
MRGQFFILSAVIIIAAIAGIVVLLSGETVSLYANVNDDTDFRLYNLESQAETVLRLSVQAGLSLSQIEDAFSGYAEYSERELAKERISATWEYELSGSQSSPTLTYTLTLKNGKTVVRDSAAVSP